VRDLEFQGKGAQKNAEWRAGDRGVEKMGTNDMGKGRRIVNDGDGNIMRGAGARDGKAGGRGDEMMVGLEGP